MSEAGVPGYHATGWVGLVAPAKTPMSVIERINSEVVKIVSDPKLKAEWASRGEETIPIKVVDRLLASEQYGVRYGRHWLDVLRYADADENMPAAPGIHWWRDRHSLGINRRGHLDCEPSTT